MISSFFIIILTSIVICGCEADMEIEHEDIEPKLIVQSYLSNEDSVVVVLSSTSSIFADNLPQNKDNSIYNVMVSINGSEYKTMERDDTYNTLAAKLEDPFIDSTGKVGSNLIPESGSKAFIYKYTPMEGDNLSIMIENFTTGETYSAQTTIPSKPVYKLEVISLDTLYTDDAPPFKLMGEYLGITLKCTIYDPAGEKNFYKLEYIDYINDGNIYRNGRRVIRRVISDDPIFNESSIVSPYFSDNLFNGKSYSFIFSAPIYPGNRIKINNEIYSIIHGNFRLRQLSEEMYLFLKSHESYVSNSRNILSVPYKVYSNINGDSFGVIGSAYHSYSDTLKYSMKCTYTYLF
ncbi:MAG: DUF4249 family protein [Bacteroidales bacterium]|nr:DUF4249 family protein [Bacteroidales bacterium]